MQTKRVNQRSSEDLYEHRSWWLWFYDIKTQWSKDLILESQNPHLQNFPFLCDDDVTRE